MKILVTGASGFIGSFVVEEALRRGYETWAAVRHTSSRAYLQDERIHFIELDLDDEERLTEQLRPLVLSPLGETERGLDYVVHAAGVTKCRNHEDFYRINTEGTKHLVNALISLGMPLKKFVYLSSLSIFGAIREDYPHQDILPTDEPQPNTDYGKSKLLAEKFLETKRDLLDYVILRPTGVYGPREKDYFLMAKSIKQHLDFAVGFKPQDITFVYVTDVVQAIFNSLNPSPSGKASGRRALRGNEGQGVRLGFFLTDGSIYSSRDFSDLIRAELGRPWWIRVTAPIWVLKIICSFAELWAKISGQMSALNNDKFHILSQRNWRCDISAAKTELGYEPKVKLPEGVKLTIEWYKKNGWI